MKCVCKQCGTTFELSEAEIDFYQKRNLQLPKRCKECRQENRQKQSGTQGSQSGGNASPKMQPSYRITPNQPAGRSKKWIYAVIALAALLLAGGSVGAWKIHQLSAELDAMASVQGDTAYSAQEQIADSPGMDEPFLADTIDDVPESLSDTVDTGENQSEVVSDTGQRIVEETGAGQQMAGETDAGQEINTAAADVEQPEPEPEPAAAAAKQYTFRSTKLMEEHFQKHGMDMGFATAQDYQAAASTVVNNQNALHKLEAEDGDDVYYLEATNEFVIVSTDGFIRTYFLPNDGIEYYNRQ
ncbi:MAG: zinc-ribbon domain containing protein [Blautia sp.]|nr:zinc-ribbon domain containing protein [Lachnoclostridium sp.]MCM1211822.1 zinc-ribbon domain containing protein [Blautia sp.]